MPAFRRVGPKRGRSPRVRRNHFPFVHRNWLYGSISARAEEPFESLDSPREYKVDLRACGGTPSGKRAVLRAAGRSPRVRRNHEVLEPGWREEGSISARAEEPSCRRRAWRSRGVDLRACGGTSKTRIAPASISGRSPRVRRNRPLAQSACAYSGSISARAEEPSSLCSCQS